MASWSRTSVRTHEKSPMIHGGNHCHSLNIPWNVFAGHLHRSGCTRLGIARGVRTSNYTCALHQPDFPDPLLCILCTSLYFFTIVSQEKYFLRFSALLSRICLSVLSGCFSALQNHLLSHPSTLPLYIPRGTLSGAHTLHLLNHSSLLMTLKSRCCQFHFLLLPFEK